MSLKDRPRAIDKSNAERQVRMYNGARSDRAVLATADALANNPLFARAVTPEATTVNPVYTLPLVLVGVCILRERMAYPTVWTAGEIDHATGIPYFAEALLAAGVVKRACNGVFDLSGMPEVIQVWRGIQVWREKKRREDVRREKRKRMERIAALTYPAHLPGEKTCYPTTPNSSSDSSEVPSSPSSSSSGPPTTAA